jgi:hypothetical protein
LIEDSRLDSGGACQYPARSGKPHPVGGSFKNLE